VTQRDRIVIGIVATIAVLGAFWFLLMAPAREEASKAAAAVTAAQTRVETARGKLATATAAKTDYNKQVLTIARLGKAVPPTDDTPSLMYQLERTARRAGVDFRSFKVEAATAAPAAASPGATPAADLKPMPFKVKFKGEFAELRKFLDYVQSFATPKGDTLDVRGRLLTVDGVAMSPDGNVWPNITADLVVSAYTAPVSDAKAAAAAPGAPTTPGAATPAASTAPAPAPADGAPANQSSTPPAAIVGGLLP
jgi:Tfp pilus assembly protein PilO